MLVEMSHQAAGTIRVTGSPVRLDGAPARATLPPPTLGEDSRRLLLEAGLSDSQVERIASDRAVVLGSPQ